MKCGKHWENEHIWDDWPATDNDFGRWYNKNSMRVVQFARYRGPDDFDKHMMEGGYYTHLKWWDKWYINMWGGGRADRELLFNTKKEAMAKLKKILNTSDMRWKL
jgi:hypothetical protein